MEQKPDSNSDLAEAMRMAQSPAGQQLLALLQKQQGGQLQDALEQASTGDYAQARDTINAFLATPEAKALLEQLGGNP